MRAITGFLAATVVCTQALDGLFLMIAEQEKAIRKDPVGSATGMARKVFGLLQK